MSTSAIESDDWGVTWFGTRRLRGVCRRCRHATRVSQGYNGDVHVGWFCPKCIAQHKSRTGGAA